MLPEHYGARGDGSTDDTRALQAAFDNAAPGATVWLSGTYRHTQVLRFRSAGSVLDGGGTLLATNELSSALWVDADCVTVRNLTLELRAAGPRRVAYEQMKLRVSNRRDLTLEHLVVRGSAAAGVFVEGVSGFRARDVKISDTRADGFHMTGGSANGYLDGIQVTRSGDDGVAVVSYAQDGPPCHDIQVVRSSVSDQTWGRGFSVVGGRRVMFHDILATRTAGAGLYLASEGDPYYTASTELITANKVRIDNANVNPQISHGAVLLFSGGPGRTVNDVRVADLHVTNTDPRSGRVVGVIGSQRDIWNISVDLRDLNPPAGGTAYTRVL